MRLSLVCLLAFVLLGCSSASVTQQIRFQGDGYSIADPAEFGMEFSRAPGSDAWVSSGSPPLAVNVISVRNLVGAEQSLEGALQRAKNGLADSGMSIEDAVAVSLPAGAAYRVTASTPGVVMLVFYRQATAVLVTMINLSPEHQKLFSESFRFD